MLDKQFTQYIITSCITSSSSSHNTSLPHALPRQAATQYIITSCITSSSSSHNTSLSHALTREAAHTIHHYLMHYLIKQLTQNFMHYPMEQLTQYIITSSISGQRCCWGDVSRWWKAHTPATSLSRCPARRGRGLLRGGGGGARWGREVVQWWLPS